MSGPPQRRMLLSRMEIAQTETQRHLGIIERQIAARAERLTITDRTKHRQHGRGASTWTSADERLFQEHVAELTLARCAEIDALTRKLDRQEKAIAEFRSRHRVSAASEGAERRATPSATAYEQCVVYGGGNVSLT